jgi:orotidine-5'-phosphate decarboxylase
MWSLVPFADRLADAVERKRSQLVVGIDPVAEQLPPGVSELEFCLGIVDAVAESAIAVKPQAAFFEALGPSGWAAYAEVCDYAREVSLLVIADAKRGDIGSTARAYATAFLEPRGDRQPLADALTVNPYLGRDSLDHGAGLFCLVKTSNPGSGDVQDVELAAGGPLWQHVARLVDEWGNDLVGECGLSSVGAVVGATYPREVAEARALLPRAPVLLPGVGAQGGQPADLAPAFAPGPAAGLVAASRSVIYAYRDGGGDWREAARAEAERLARESWSVAEVS